MTIRDHIIVMRDMKRIALERGLRGETIMARHAMDAAAWHERKARYMLFIIYGEES